VNDSTASSVDASESLARTVLAAYDLPPILDVRTLNLGNNATFEVTTEPAESLDSGSDRSSHRFVLRIHRPGYRTIAHTRSEVHFLQEVRKYLDHTHVDVPQPVPARDGRLVVQTHVPASQTSAGGPRHCDVLSWVAGDVLVPGGGLTLDAIHSLGKALAHLHNAAERVEIPAYFDLPHWDAAGMFTTEASPFRPVLSLDEILSPSDRKLFAHIADRTRKVFETLKAETHTSVGIIHGDYILGNCHLSRAHDEWDVGVIDFADCGWGFFLYDLCPLLGNLAGYPGAIPDNADYPALRSAYLDGYRTTRPLPPSWEAHLPVLMAARNASHCLWTAGLDMSPTPQQDAAWRMDLARRCLELPC
jgi:Ser/Thr protein kinase RdoA (MazF antagonist)